METRAQATCQQMARKKKIKYFCTWMFKREKKRENVRLLRQRYGDLCWRCHHPMRFDAPFNKGKSATIEHVLAKAAGGTSAIENLRLCHEGCNKHLGTNPPEQKERMRQPEARRANAEIGLLAEALAANAASSTLPKAR